MLCDNIYNIEALYQNDFAIFFLLFLKLLFLLNFFTDSILYFTLIKRNYESVERTRRLVQCLYSLLCKSYFNIVFSLAFTPIISYNLFLVKFIAYLYLPCAMTSQIVYNCLCRISRNTLHPTTKYIYMTYPYLILVYCK
jgi:hypothetical protein